MEVVPALLLMPELSSHHFELLSSSTFTWFPKVKHLVLVKACLTFRALRCFSVSSVGTSLLAQRG